MRKYKLLSKASTNVRLSGVRTRAKKGSLIARLRDKVRAFYERDDVNIITSGMKETVSRNWT